MCMLAYSLGKAFLGLAKLGGVVSSFFYHPHRRPWFFHMAQSNGRMTFVAQENDLSLACGHLLPETSCFLLGIASAVNE